MKNWYILSLKKNSNHTGSYKKAIFFLIKRKIEIYHPKGNDIPIFNDIIFIKSTIDIVRSLKSDEFTLMYWLSSPAIISEDDIERIKLFPKDNVRVEKIPVNSDINESYDKTLILPSIGVKLISESGFKKLVETNGRLKFLKSLFT